MPTTHNTINHSPESGADFVLTRELLEGAVDTKQGPTSAKLAHPEFPAVIVRQLQLKRVADLNMFIPGRVGIRTQEGFIEGLRDKYRTHYQELRNHGIEVPEFAVMADENGETKIITHKVIGMPLEDAVKMELPGAIEGLHQSIFHQVSYLKAMQDKGEDGEYLADIIGAKQRMFGHYTGETEAEDRVILVDINPDDEEDFQPANTLKDLGMYLAWLISMAVDVVKAEAASKVRPENSARGLLRAEMSQIADDQTYSDSTRKFALDTINAFDANDIAKLSDFEEY
ncbi:MAG: hypothetical protein ACHQT9_01505 [Candidatus Saccharimonadales bacterium]